VAEPGRCPEAAAEYAARARAALSGRRDAAPPAVRRGVAEAKGAVRCWLGCALEWRAERAEEWPAESGVSLRGMTGATTSGKLGRGTTAMRGPNAGRRGARRGVKTPE